MTGFQDMPTTCISDCTNGLNNMDSSIKPLKEDFHIAGRAFTVKMPVGDNLGVLKAIKEAQPGDILVIDAKGDTYRGIAGDFIVGLAKTLDIQGIVTDGVIRDIKGIKELNFPVFCKGTAVAASGKAGMGEIDVPISCGGVAVYPGDLIVGDGDGVVVIPQADQEKILEQSKDKLQSDILREESITGDLEKSIKYIEDFLAKHEK